jgi:hypothetical protein
MINRRQAIAAVVLVLALAAGVHADMVSVFSADAVPKPPVQVCGLASDRPVAPYVSLIDPLVADLDLWSVAVLPTADVEPTDETQQPVYLLTHDRQGSLDLCLYALVGLGMCKSAPWIKKLHLGVIPDWYHHGGPAQIGHSLPIGPNCLCSTAVCFVQPDCGAEDSIPPQRLGTNASLRRTSQSTPAVRASRAPPLA